MAKKFFSNVNILLFPTESTFPTIGNFYYTSIINKFDIYTASGWNYLASYGSMSAVIEGYV